MRRAAAALLVVPLALALGACESNQTRSRRIAERRAAAEKQAATIDVSRPNADVAVRRTAVLRGDGGTAAVAVELTDRGKGQSGVPILVDVKDATGRSVYRNDQAGLQDALQRVGGIPAGKSVWWVDDQVLGGAAARTATVRVGAARATGDVPEMEFTHVRLAHDASGAYLTGTIANPSAVAQTLLAVYAVALKGDRVVAAGRALVASLPARRLTTSEFRIVFVGDPRGARYVVNAAPTAG